MSLLVHHQCGRAFVDVLAWPTSVKECWRLQRPGSHSDGDSVCVTDVQLMCPGSLKSAIDLVEQQGWTGLGIDNENFPPTMPAAMPSKFALLLGNLSKVRCPCAQCCCATCESCGANSLLGTGVLYICILNK